MHYRKYAAMLALVLFALPVAASDDEATSPVGLWKTISDTTGKPAGLVEITLKDGLYSGRILQLLEKDPATVCEECTDARKNQPLIGMTFLTGLKKSGDEFDGGEILDPNNGRIYRAKMKLVDGGSKLDVRAYLGFSLLGRTPDLAASEIGRHDA